MIILACCLCMLQKFRTDKHHTTVIVKKEVSRNQNDKNNWHNPGLQQERKNLIYNDTTNDEFVP